MVNLVKDDWKSTTAVDGEQFVMTASATLMRPLHVISWILGKSVPTNFSDFIRSLLCDDSVKTTCCGTRCVTLMRAIHALYAHGKNSRDYNLV